jgi:hypothetical protein
MTGAHFRLHHLFTVSPPSQRSRPRALRAELVVDSPLLALGIRAGVQRVLFACRGVPPTALFGVEIRLGRSVPIFFIGCPVISTSETCNLTGLILVQRPPIEEVQP